MELETTYLKYILQYPEIIGITKYRSLNGVVYHSENIFEKPGLCNALCWIYNHFYNKNVILFNLKELTNVTCSDDTIEIVGDLESFETLKYNVSQVIIINFADLMFINFNYRRLNTLLKNFIKKNKVIILSSSSLKAINLNVLDSFDYLTFPQRPLVNYNTLLDYISLVDIIDDDPETYASNIDDLVDLIVDLASNDKKIYISLNLGTTDLRSLETKLLEKELTVSRKENQESNVVINSSKSTNKLFLKNVYQVFIFLLPDIESPLELISYFKNVITNNEIEVLLDSSKIKTVSKYLKLINDTILPEKISIKDSGEYQTIEEIILEDKTMASENWFLFNSPKTVMCLDLKNLNKKNYDTIRDFVKLKLLTKYDIECKTCQLSTPCSPKDRSKKLNSLSNKISSADYRCDVTCEIFKDYTIGVVVWNEVFSDRKNLNKTNLKGSNYVYQTTSGKWKYTIVN